MNALEILEHTGVVIQNQDTLKLLKGAGCPVSGKGGPGESGKETPMPDSKAHFIADRLGRQAILQEKTCLLRNGIGSFLCRRYRHRRKKIVLQG